MFFQDGYEEAFKSSDNSNINDYLEAFSSANYYFIYKEGRYNNLVYSFSPIDIYKGKNIYNFIVYFISSDTDLYFVPFSVTNGTQSAGLNTYSGGIKTSRNDITTVFQANFNIIDSKSGDIYYTVPTVLQKSTEGVSFEGVLNEVLDILPIVLVVVVGFIGIRKGISFIINNLRKC